MFMIYTYTIYMSLYVSLSLFVSICPYVLNIPMDR